MFYYKLHFLCAQLLYIYVIGRRLPRSSWIQRILAAVPFAIYLFALMSVLKPGLGEFTVPVWVYASVISVFGLMALLNFMLRRSSGSGVLLLGAVLFILSDSMIALNKFYASREFYPVANMLTYVLAQYFIFTYMVSVDNKEED